MEKLNLRRRGVLSAAVASLTGIVLAGGTSTGMSAPARVVDWREHFDRLNNGAILADLRERMLHFWQAEGGAPRSYRISVPQGRDVLRPGMTRVIRKVEGPTWRPTPAMRERNPRLPSSLPPGPGNPFGSHALYLDWDHVRIHGSADPAEIGRETAHGCIGLANADIVELFVSVTVGTPVRLI
ncbi:L,D-transpeptidase-like protein [Cereibacter ovatus]|uniref:L,D-transpeptidase-like protein n=2 Tax=Cereibacter ovatus TaxID=439529 RepID=A0A285CK86_9RHOB|nr:L,D-transpeptidase-like protein [Cereibacter ovatus]